MKNLIRIVNKRKKKISRKGCGLEPHILLEFPLNLIYKCYLLNGGKKRIIMPKERSYIRLVDHMVKFIS